MRQLVSNIRRRLFSPSETLEGYQQPELVDVIFRKTLAYQPQGEWSEVSGAATVLDFGGGCGLHYKQANSSARWAVVETPAMVDRAKEFATDRLQFFTSISDAANWLGSIDLMHSNGAIQYSTDPMQRVHDLCGVGARKILWYRLFFSDVPLREIQSSYLGDNGPGSMQVKEKVVTYQRTAITENAFQTAHHGYRIDGRGKDWFSFTKHV